MASKFLRVKLERLPELLLDNPGRKVWVESECLGVLVMTARSEVLRASKVFPEREVIFMLGIHPVSCQPCIFLQTPGGSHGKG